MEPRDKTGTIDVERSVRERYSRNATAPEAALSCSTQYDAAHLEAIPREIIERDFGCGDPSRYVAPGDTVVDLGSGAGKICFIASQIVGPEGRVIGVDMNDEMLALARRHAPEVARRIGYGNVEFRRGRIQDLALNMDRLDAWLGENPIQGSAGISALEDFSDRLRREAPLVSDASVDIVVSNCVLNLVRDRDKRQLISEIFRVLGPGGRIAISDIVSDREVPDKLKADPDLWSGCISGAFQERRFLGMLEEVGFHGIAIDKWEDRPRQVVDGIEFRSVTVIATKPNPSSVAGKSRTVIYKGPWKQVEDDDGHVLHRGERSVVDERTFAMLTSGGYKDQVAAMPDPGDRKERGPKACC